MPTLEETFPPPSLDTDRWNETLVGAGVSSNVGVPQDGYYPINVDDAGESATVDSDDKIIVPGQVSFDYHFFFEDRDNVDPGEVAAIFLGWKSLEQQLNGDPKHEVEFRLEYTFSTFNFAKFTRDMGSTFDGIITPDPASGTGVGGLRMVRDGFLFRLLRWSSDLDDWIEVDSFDFSDNGLGYVTFGLRVDAVVLETVPWIIGT